MQSLELNKIAGAVLTAGIVASISGFIASTIFHREHLETPAYVVAGAERAPKEAAAGAEPTVEPVAPLLAAASADAGATVAKKCATCHTFEKGGANKIGPHLWGIVNRPIASVEDFSYSDALKAKSGEEWTYANLDGFVHKPKDWAPGTKMGFAGIAKIGDRADLIAYLRTLSDEPAPLPEPDKAAGAAEAVQQTAQAAAETVTEAAGQAAEAVASTAGQAAEAVTGAVAQMATAATGGLEPMIAAADAQAGKKSARLCTACHNFEEGAGNKIGPNLHGIVGRHIATAEGYPYSSALKDKSGETWTYANLDAFLSKPKDFASGTKMSFAGIRKAEDRAAVIAYLRSISPNAPPLSQ